jgi:tetratricopeptide (TPR) repeat protein
MSVLAKSLKKQKELKKQKGSSHKIKSNTININTIFIIFALMLLLMTFFYAYSQYKSTKVETNIHLPDIKKLKTKYNNEVKKLSKHKDVTIPEKLTLYLTTNKIDQLYKLAESTHNNKFLGIYYFLKEDYSLSENYLRKYIANKGIDSSSGSYLAKIYYQKGHPLKSLKVLNSLPKFDGIIAYNKAVIYEKLNDYNKAFNSYKNSLTLIKDPLMKYRIKVKLFVLQRNFHRDIYETK